MTNHRLSRPPNYSIKSIFELNVSNLLSWMAMYFSHKISIEFRREVPSFIIFFNSWFIPILYVLVNKSFILCFAVGFHIECRLFEISLIYKSAMNCLQQIFHILLRLLHFRFDFLISLINCNFFCANLLKLLGFDFVSFGQICPIRNERSGSI